MTSFVNFPDKNKIIGYSQKDYYNKNSYVVYDKDLCRIVEIFVKNNFRKQQIGSELLKKAEKELKKHNCKKTILINKSSDNKIINIDNFFLKNGYQWKNPYFRYIFYNPYTMEKEL